MQAAGRRHRYGRQRGRQEAARQRGAARRPELALWVHPREAPLIGAAIQPRRRRWRWQGVAGAYGRQCGGAQAGSAGRQAVVVVV